MRRLVLVVTVLTAVLPGPLAFGQPSAITQFRLNREAINAGRVTAVLEGRAERVTAGTVAAQAAAGAVFVERQRTQPVAAALPPSLATPDAASGIKLSYQFTARSAETKRAVTMDAWARDSTGLLLDAARSAYSGTFDVALVDSANPAARTTLATPVTVAVTARGAASIDPRPLRIAELAQWHPVSIVVPDAEGTGFPVSVSAAPGRPGDAIELAVRHPRIRLWSTPASIVGWGIGRSTIHLEAAGMRVTEGFRVAVGSTNGALASGSITLDTTGYGVTRLRSSRDAGTVIRVQNLPLTDSLDVRFDAPWLFLGVAIAGGLAGAFVRGRGRHHWPRALAIGVVSALIMTLAFAVGIDWPARVLGTEMMEHSGEAVVFVLGALGALVGVSALVPGRG